jgi:putative membrane protein
MAWAELDRPDVVGLLVALGAGGLLSWLSASHLAALPAWMPWDFSWTEFLAAVLALWWYVRGVARTPAAEVPSMWRQAAFALGVALIYGVLLTHFEYMAQHMFFLNRLQHMVMHHLGPFLIALAWPGDALLRGMPAPLGRALDSPGLRRMLRIVQQPALAGALFAGLIGLWLIPGVHFRAMIDPRLYDVMNWSMVLDGLLFWCLVLDPRPWPAARTSFAMRMIVTVAVMFPQIAMGAAITFSNHALYAYYDLCGRLYPSIGALIDQHIGGTIVWIPSAMMSSVAFMLILNNIRLYEDRISAEEANIDDGRNVVFSSRWTGR